MNKLWDELLTDSILIRGWHLARLDTRQDFAEDLYSTDIYAVDFGIRIKETISRLKTDTYQPRPLIPLEVPKGSLGFRPGSIIPIQDRIIVSAIVFLMAEKIDERFPKSVHSWRTKKPFPKKGSIFKEIDMAEVPFLKKKSIKKIIEPFESWYDVWPSFDIETRRVFEVEGYRFLATSDIAAYFENIQLPILRDQLLQYFPEEPKIVNLLFIFLESWAVRTSYGRIHLRGIPQGNFVSSFLGNLFLLPLDLKFEDFEKEYVQTAISTILVQKRYKNEEIIKNLMFHPNEKVSDIGKLFRSIKTNETFANKRLKHIFRSDSPWLLCDNVPFLFLMSYSDNRKIKERLIKTIRDPRYNHPITGLRRLLKKIFTRTRESLKIIQ